MNYKKYIPVYGIKYMELEDTLEMFVYHNLCLFAIILIISELIF